MPNGELAGVELRRRLLARASAGDGDVGCARGSESTHALLVQIVRRIAGRLGGELGTLRTQVLDPRAVQIKRQHAVRGSGRPSRRERARSRGCVTRELRFDAADLLVELVLTTLELHELPPEIRAIGAEVRFGAGAARESQRSSNEGERRQQPAAYRCSEHTRA